MNEIHVESYWNFYSNIAPNEDHRFWPGIPPTALFWYDPCWLWGEFPLEDLCGKIFQGLSCSPPGWCHWRTYDWRLHAGEEDGNTWILSAKVFILLFWDISLDVSKSFQSSLQNMSVSLALFEINSAFTFRGVFLDPGARLRLQNYLFWEIKKFHLFFINNFY